MIKLVVGLGNPGQQYEKTRHNAGFIFLEHLADAGGCVWTKNSQFQGETTSYLSDGNRLVLLKPLTFMNKSGSSVASVLAYYKLKPEEMLVVHDELELPEGLVRLKREGGHAGHNGLRDIIAHIGSKDFYRLRIGIGRPLLGKNIADYVLSTPGQQALLRLDSLCLKMIEKMDLLLSGDVVEINLLTSIDLY